MKNFIFFLVYLLLAVITASPIISSVSTTWTGAPQLVEVANLPPVTLAKSTLRQYVHASIGGSKIQLVFNNFYGDSAVTLNQVSVALPLGNTTGNGLIQKGTSRTVTFLGSKSVTIEAGALVVSDVLPFLVKPLSNLVISTYFSNMPVNVTGHPGSRTTSFIAPGNLVEAQDLSNATQTNHWYYLSSIRINDEYGKVSIAVLGDSLTDGRGTTTNGNDRWPDLLAKRLQRNKQTQNIGVLNSGIGGGRLIRFGLGPSALSRLDSDVLAQPGVRWLIVFEGINDIGTAVTARTSNQTYATARDVIAAYDQIIVRSHAMGILVYGCTLLPFGGSFYDSLQSELDRVTVNNWIRKSGRFDAVFDFEAAVKDPKNSTALLPSIDTGDHLHLNPSGYQILANTVDLKYFVL
ncbi:hypothetical protein HK096_004008 [Nowakowskiella sp. JEL0078]|nr:hypothetical protein HK096_004008 [Nowakowskiella sp. JEL0078]